MEIFCRCLKGGRHPGTGSEKVLAFGFETNSNLRSCKGKKGWYKEKNSTDKSEFDSPLEINKKVVKVVLNIKSKVQPNSASVSDESVSEPTT